MPRRPRPQPVSPAGFLREAFDPSGRTGPGGLAALALPMAALWAAWRWGPALAEGWGRGHEALVVLPLAALMVPALGHVLRRLNDMGWSGWWAWALLLPWVRWALAAALLAVPASQRRRATDSPLRAIGYGVACLLAVGLAASLLWTTAIVAGPGMRPALSPGDWLLVRRAPLVPARGDVVAFRLAGEAGDRAARVAGLPGERVAVEGGVPVIDGRPAAQVADGYHVEPFGRQGPRGAMPLCGNGTVGLGAPCRTRRLLETLPGGPAHAVLDVGLRPLDRAPEVEVPPGALYVLGDDRDAGQDSRLAVGAGGTGLVPEAALIGRVDLVLLSSASERLWDPRGWRWSRIGEVVR